MVVGITDVKHLDWLGQIRVTGTACAAALLIIAGIVTGVLANMAIVSATTWPYTVVDRQMIGINGNSKDVLVKIPREGDITMQRWIDYHEVDCERWYNRRAVSEERKGDDAGRVQRFDPVYDPMLPSDLSGRWQTWKATLSPTFPCGKAYLAETVTASCGWFNRVFYKLHKPTIITPFEVVGC